MSESVDRTSGSDVSKIATDGGSSHQLRADEGRNVSRRGVLWRAGLAGAAGVGALTLLDAQRADAATGGSFILGGTNNAGQTTSLQPTAATNSNPLFEINGSALSATSTAMIVDSPAGGAGLAVNGSSTSTTVGIALVARGNGNALGISASSGSGTAVQASTTSSNGVYGSATSGTGVYGNASTGVGVHATSASGTALYVNGKVHFTRSGAVVVPVGHSNIAVTVAGMTSNSLVLVTLQTATAGVYVLGAVPTTGKFTAYLSKAAVGSTRLAWFLVSG